MVGRKLWSSDTTTGMMKLLHPVRSRIAGILWLIFLIQVFQLLVPYAFKLVLDTIESGVEVTQRLITLVMVVVILGFVISLFKYVRDLKFFDFILLLEQCLPVQAQNKLLELSLDYHEEHETGTTVVKIQKGADRSSDLMANCHYEFFPTLFQTVATLGFLCVLEGRVGLIFLAAIPGFLWLTHWFNDFIQPIRRWVHDYYEIAGGKMVQSLMNVRTVQAFVQQRREVATHARIRKHIRRVEMRGLILIARSVLVRDGLINIGRAAILAFALFLVYQQQMTLGTLVLVVTLADNAYLSLFRISRIYDHGAEWSEAIVRLSLLLQEMPRVCNRPKAMPLGQMRSEIEFDRVSFSYNGNATALNDVSMAIQPGTTVALVGHSGSGKTTCTKLIYRFVDPTSGTVRIDGQDLRDLTLQSFQSQMALVPQEVDLFNLTVRENIAYGRPEATLDEVRAAATMANADEFIATLPERYQTLVGERGVKLSGGQRQRIGIARAILPNPRIIIFDEATSNLDSHSERLIQQALRRIGRNRTVIVIAHRLSTIRDADWIYVFDQGRIVEQGTHEQLIAQEGRYWLLHQLQHASSVIHPSKI